MSRPVPELVARLALQAIDDETALPVLGDAVQEARWSDRRVIDLMYRGRARENETAATVIRSMWREQFAHFSAHPTPEWARAVAAVGLFGRWSKRPWRIRGVALGDETVELIDSPEVAFGHGSQLALAARRLMGSR